MNEAERLLPKMPLDDLLAEVQSRLHAVMSVRDDVLALLEAVVSIGRDLDLDAALRRTVETAVGLADCRYGALGVIGEDGTLEQFIPVGLSEDEIERIGEWPHGRGLLGLLVQDPRPLRLAEIAAHEDSCGFPPGHPPMRTFLGVPIRIRDAVFGNLYLTEKNGGAEFDEQDEAVVAALATAAGVAIENARLYDRSRRREIWLDASAEVSRALLSRGDLADAVGLLLQHGREMAGAAAAVLLAPRRGERGVRVAATDGDGSARLDGLELADAGPHAEAVLSSGESELVSERVRGTEPDPLLDLLPGGAAMVVPMGAPLDLRGVLVLAKEPGSGPFTVPTQRMVEAFAAQATLALELAEARRVAERHGLVDDRERIARDLHDVVVQRLFAVAMSLSAATRLVDHPDVAARIDRAVEDLDGTIRQIRSTIFALQRWPGGQAESLRERVVAAVGAAREQLGFEPGLHLVGELDSAVPDDVAEQLVPVLQEALSNVVHHANATRLDVVVSVAGGVVRLQVTDDGVGLPEDGRRSGLANLAERARGLGGRFSARSGSAGGTTLRWEVPTEHRSPV